MSYRDILKEKNLTVALVAPSRGTDKNKISKAVKRLRYLGINKILYNKNVVKNVLGYWSGKDYERASELQKYFENTEVNIIWCLNGGMASLELIPFLDFNKIKKNRKLFIGFSDITSLQQALLHYSKLESLQFYMPGTEPWINDKREILLFKQIIELKDFYINFSAKKVYQKGFASGELVGGCLELVCNTLGTEYEISTKNKILYLEDTNLTPQKLYNLLCHLYIAGKFNKIKGLIFAEMKGCGNYSNFINLFLKKLEDKKIPIIKEIKAGHANIKAPILIGGKCDIDTFNCKLKIGFSHATKRIFKKNLIK